MSGRKTFYQLCAYIGSPEVNAGYDQGAVDRWSLLDRDAAEALFASTETPTLAQLKACIRKGKEVDCSAAFFVAAYLASGGLVTIDGTRYTGNQASVATESGLFEALRYQPGVPVKAQTHAGDTLLTPGHHTVEVLKGGATVLSPEYNEKGGTLGGKPGDQTGREVKIRPIYVRPGGWTYVLRWIRPAVFKGQILARLAANRGSAAAVRRLKVVASYDGPLWGAFAESADSRLEGMALNFDAPSPVLQADHAFVVLGSKLKPDGTPTAKFVRRLQLALDAANENPASLVVVSGGKPYNNTTEAKAGAAWLTGHGLDPARVVLESGSGSTIGNAVYTVPLLARLKLASYTLVSDASHLRRASLDFDAAQLRLETATNTLLGLTPTTPLAYNDYGTEVIKPTQPAEADARRQMIGEVATVLGLSEQYAAAK